VIWDVTGAEARIATLPLSSIVVGLFSSSLPGKRSRAASRKVRPEC